MSAEMAYANPYIHTREREQNLSIQDRLLGQLALAYFKLLSKLPDIKSEIKGVSRLIQLKRAADAERSSNTVATEKKDGFPDLFDREVNFLIETTKLEEKEMFETIFKHLSAIFTEYFRQPITPSYWDVNTGDQDSSQELRIIYPFYQFRADLVEICRTGLGSTVIDPVERARYQKEFDQAERLLARVESVIPADTLDSSNQLNLKQQGFTPTTANFLSPDIINPLWITPKEKIWVGQKMIYIMPESSAHPGGTSIVVLVQPVFIPSQQKWVLIHDQYLDFIPWKDHINLVKQFGTNNSRQQPQISAGLEAKEEYVMTQLLTLPDRFSTLSAQDTFRRLMPTFNKGKQFRQKMSRAVLKKMTSSLERLTELTVEYIKNEDLNTNSSVKQREKTKAFWKRVVLASVFGMENITKNKHKKLQRVSQQLHNGTFTNEGNFALSISGIIPSAIKGFNTSIVECVLGSMASVGRQGLSSGSMFNPTGLLGEKGDSTTCPNCCTENVTSSFSHCPGCNLKNPFFEPGFMNVFFNTNNSQNSARETTAAGHNTTTSELSNGSSLPRSKRKAEPETQSVGEFFANII